MYKLTCDGLPLLDCRDNDLVIVNPKVNLEVNKVGEGSFTIYKNHPNYGSLKKLKSVFEVTDEHGVIFRGRATGDTVDFDHGMNVDLEGVMAYFNDSVVRPYSFPDDFLENADYIAAAESGNVVEFFLDWLIANHNSQTEAFQHMKRGNVTVSDPNNYIIRSNSNYSSTWETMKAKLFDSSLGGYLCIRYEQDGNYIDYLSEFTTTNSQEIVFGENLLDMKSETVASETYSAIIPFGVAGLTIEGQKDGDVTEDLVKSGDTIYSRSAVEEYGWIYAPVSATTWEDVTDDANLLIKGAEWLANGGRLLMNGIEVTAVDLHFTDEQVESLRIYKNVNVKSTPHEVSEVFPLKKLEIDLLSPQNTKIAVGKTIMSLTDRTALQQDEALARYSKISKTAEEIRLEVVDKVAEIQSEIVQTAEAIESRVSNAEGDISLIEQTVNNITLSVSESSGMDGQTYASITLRVGDNYYTGQILLDGNVNVSGQLSADALYAALGNIANLTVDKLSTSRRIKMYLAGDTNDDNYILAQNEELCFMSGVYAGGTEQAESPTGGLIYWESNPNASGVVLGTDGYPYKDGVRIYTTTIETDWPVMVYTYTELAKAKFAFEMVDGIYTPVLTMGAGNANGYNQGRIVKSTDGLEILFSPASGGEDIGIRMGNAGYTDILGLRKVTGLNFSEFDSGVFYERIAGDSERYAYNVEFDSSGNPIKITDSSGHECYITW